MMGVIAAEFAKLTRHRAIWGLVWIFPLGLTVVFLLGLALHARHIGPERPSLPMSADVWITGSTLAWKAVASGPGRYFTAAFTALAFGGEYGWNTWKLIVPHSRRLKLVAAKYLVVFCLMFAAFVLAAALTLVFNVVSATTNGQGMPSGLTVSAILSAHGRGALAAIVPTLLAMGYASAAAVLLRSTMGGAIAGIVLITAEGIAGLFAPILDPTLFMALPTYHLKNLSDWIVSGSPATQVLAGAQVHHDWSFSLVILAAWTVAMIGFAAAWFDRQDLN